MGTRIKETPEALGYHMPTEEELKKEGWWGAIVGDFTVGEVVHMDKDKEEWKIQSHRRITVH